LFGPAPFEVASFKAAATTFSCVCREASSREADGFLRRPDPLAPACV
jgi:hypothetical protein